MTVDHRRRRRAPRQLVAEPGHAGSQSLEPRGPAGQADDRPLGRRTGGTRSAPSVGWCNAASHRSQRASSTARRAGQQPGSALGVEHARPRARPAAGGGPAPTSRARSASGVLPAPVDDLDDRPARRAPRPRDGVSSGPHRPAPPATGSGETSTQGTPARRARSMATSRACQVGRPLLLERLVVLVEHHDGGQVGDGRPRRGPGPDHHGGPGRGQRPVPRGQRHGHARPAQAGAEQARLVDRGRHHQRRRLGRPRPGRAQRVDRRREPHHGAAARRAPSAPRRRRAARRPEPAAGPRRAGRPRRRPATPWRGTTARVRPIATPPTPPGRRGRAADPSRSPWRSA